MSTQTFTGVLTELGGPEVSPNTGNEKPRKVVIKDDPTKQYGKTFRTWSNSEVWERLQPLNGQRVTVEFVVEERQGGPSGTYNQNVLVDVLENGDGGGVSARVGGEVSEGTTTAPSSAADWTPPPAEWQTTKAQIESKDDYWEQRAVKDEERSREMEAAWALKAVLDLEGPDHDLSDDSLVEFAVRLALLKRRVASEMK